MEIWTFLSQSHHITSQQKAIIEWICGIFAFCAAFFIGANDLANSMATLYGSRALSLKQVAVLGAIFETIGAMTLGLRVSTHLDEWVINSNDLSKLQRDQFSVSMISVLSVTFVILCIASVTGIPISSTQLTIGCFIGVIIPIQGLVFNYTHFSLLIAAWIISPVISFLLTLGFYYLIKKYIIFHRKPDAQSVKFLPFFISFSFSVTILFIFLEFFSRYFQSFHLEAYAFVIAVATSILSLLITRFCILSSPSNAYHQNKYQIFIYTLKFWDLRVLAKHSEIHERYEHIYTLSSLSRHSNQGFKISNPAIQVTQAKSDLTSPLLPNNLTESNTSEKALSVSSPIKVNE